MTEVLGPVLELPAEDRAVLLNTLQAYLEHGGSAERTAQVLYCHPNTVRYGLRRLHDLTGRSLSDPGSLAELATPAYALRVDRRWQPADRASAAGSSHSAAWAGT